MQNIFKQAHIALLFVILLTLPGCGFLEDIFAMGFWAGVLGVIILIALIWFLVRAVKRK